MKKYKIIENTDANGEKHYEVWIGTSWILGDRWKPVRDRYNNLNQAVYAVKSMQIKKKVVDQGMIHESEEN